MYFLLKMVDNPASHVIVYLRAMCFCLGLMDPHGPIIRSLADAISLSSEVVRLEKIYGEAYIPWSENAWKITPRQN